MSKRYKVTSGEFCLVINEESCETAAIEAIKLHDESSHHSLLGKITMVEGKTDTKFFCTVSLIDNIYSDSFSANFK